MYLASPQQYQVVQTGVQSSVQLNGKYSGQKSLFFPKQENPRILISSLFQRRFGGKYEENRKKSWKIGAQRENFRDFDIIQSKMGPKCRKIPHFRHFLRNISNFFLYVQAYFFLVFQKAYLFPQGGGLPARIFTIVPWFSTTFRYL